MLKDLIQCKDGIKRASFVKLFPFDWSFCTRVLSLSPSSPFTGIKISQARKFSKTRPWVCMFNSNEIFVDCNFWYFWFAFFTFMIMKRTDQLPNFDAALESSSGF